jgi:hypothetical protein
MISESSPGSDVREKDISSRQKAPSPRFRVSAGRHRPGQAVPWMVHDDLLQITVFHWYGDSGERKARAVAEALEQLKDED